MADILDPKIAQSLIDAGLMKPEIAQQLYTPVPVPQEDVVAPAEEVVEPVQDVYAQKAQEMQNLDLATRPQVARESAQMQQPKPREQEPMKVLSAIEADRQKQAMIDNAAQIEQQEKIKNRQVELQKAAELGVQLPVNEVDALIAEQNKEQEKINLQAQEQAAQELEAQKQQAEVEAQKEEQRRAVATEQAIVENEAQAAEKEAQKAAKIDQKVAAQDAEVAEIAKESNWFEPGSLSFVIAAALGGATGVGSGQGGNPFIEGYTNRIKREAEAKKMSDEQKVAAEKLALERLKLALDEKKSALTDAKTIAEINKLTAETNEKLGKANVQQRMGKGDGLTREELFTLYPENKDRQAFVAVGDRFYETANDDEAKKIGAAKDSLELSLPAIKGLKQIADSSVFNRLTPTARANAESYQTQAVGAMRLLLLGPGTMTDTEQALVRRIIANPTEFKNMIFSDAAKSNLNLIEKKLKQAYNDKLRAQGIPVPISKNEVRLENFIRKNPGIDRQEAMTALINKGLWLDE